MLWPLAEAVQKSFRKLWLGGLATRQLQSGTNPAAVQITLPPSLPVRNLAGLNGFCVVDKLRALWKNRGIPRSFRGTTGGSGVGRENAFTPQAALHFESYILIAGEYLSCLVVYRVCVIPKSYG